MPKDELDNPHFILIEDHCCPVKLLQGLMCSLCILLLMDSLISALDLRVLQLLLLAASHTVMQKK
jgi:hypothetical protein